MTSAPKSDRITAAAGHAMKLARSTTFNPEKILSVAIYTSVDFAVRYATLPASCFLLPASCFLSPPTKLRHALFQESRRTFILVFRRSAQAEIGGFQREAFALARVHPFVDRLERMLDGDRRVGGDLFEDRFRARDQVGSRDDFVDEPNAVSLLRADHRAGQNELKRAALSDQPRQPLGAAAAGKQSQLDLGLAEFRVLNRDADGARHCCLATAAQGKAVDCRDHRLAEILDQIEHLLPDAAGPFGVDRTRMREFADVGTGNERLVARAGEDDAVHRGVV